MPTLPGKVQHESRDEERIIESRPGPVSFGLLALWSHRELLWIFLKRQISIRYRQMVLGVLWGLLEPLGLLLMMVTVFGWLLRVDSNGYPYPVFAFAALVPWQYFSKGTTAAASSLVENMGLISKVYFPRLILPVSGVLRELFDAAMVFLILVILAAAYGFLPGLRLLVAPVLFAYVGMSALAVGLWLACVMVPFRDIRPLLGLTLQAGMFATPILYPATLVPAAVLPFYQLNPMYWSVEFFRWMLLDKEIELNASFFISVGLIVGTLIGGLAIFAAAEKKIVDVQ